MKPSNPINNPSKSGVKYFSMFSGVGGFELGIQRAMDNRGVTSTPALATRDSTLPTISDGVGRWTHATCIGYSEIDKYAIQTYEKNWKGHHNYGDATKLDTARLPDFDLLVGGFPCQAFSIAGKRRGFDEARGTLFFEIARVLKDKRPRHFILENVQGLLSHDSGKTFQTILGVLADLGYGVEWQVLNGKRWVPQNRVRVIIIGHLRDECGRKILPFRQDDRLDNETWQTQEQKVYRTLEATEYKGVSSERFDAIQVAPTIRAEHHNTADVHFIRTDEPSTSEIGDKPDNSNTIRRASHTDVARPAQWRRTEKGKAFRREAQRNGRDLTPFNDGHRELVPKDSNVVGSITAHAVAKDSLLFERTRIRRLTPLECERLMGWEDNWTEGVSDTQRYKQCGNGIIAPMVTAVIERLCT